MEVELANKYRSHRTMHHLVADREYADIGVLPTTWRWHTYMLMDFICEVKDRLQLPELYFDTDE